VKLILVPAIALAYVVEILKVSVSKFSLETKNISVFLFVHTAFLKEQHMHQN
jgi:hypothetical protein